MNPLDPSKDWENIPMSSAIIDRLKAEGLTLLEYFVLVAKLGKYKWLTKLRVPSGVYDSLRAKGYLTATRTLSSDGADKMLHIIGGDISEKIEMLRDDFEDLWNLYPSNDKIHSFPMTRSSMKGKKNECFHLYVKLRENYDAKTIYEGLKNELDWRVSTSIKENKMTFMPHIHRWLKEERFLDWRNKGNTNPNEHIVEIENIS